MINESSFREN
ncbi:hypothetical protein F383_38956 [Gossypium arboreum]|uniref:Uncharacterized protein n=1 Tax=Gossypium arboreum TaxID=29729 RepID=A0A0B0ME91_GOSAR|nr:hypothetical protein F383_38956 [Gossypium arboreum]